MLGSPHSPYSASPLRRKGSGMLPKTAARRTAVISLSCLIVSALLNVALLFSRLIPSTPDQAHLVELAQTPPLQDCPAVNCSRVCAREAARNVAAARMAASTAGSAVSSRRQSAAAGGGQQQLEDTLLFIGALSGRGYRHRRLAVRDAWANACQLPGVSVCRFILSDDEVTPLVDEEMAEYQDIVLLHGETTYKSILLKTLFVFEYAVAHYDVRFVLKTDDDAFVNVRYLVAQLRLLCESADCRSERLYMGRMCTHGEVITTPGHKWNNEAYYNHTGLDRYANYMLGGGYVMSADVVRALMRVMEATQLKFTPIEDATIGMWLMPMDLRAIDHPMINTMFWPCCFKELSREKLPGEAAVTGFELDEDTEKHLCTDDPWIILHKLDSPTRMRYVGQRFAACPRRPDERVVPASIATWVDRIGAAEK